MGIKKIIYCDVKDCREMLDISDYTKSEALDDFDWYTLKFKDEKFFACDVKCLLEIIMICDEPERHIENTVEAFRKLLRYNQSPTP